MDSSIYWSTAPTSCSAWMSRGLSDDELGVVLVKWSRLDARLAAARARVTRVFDQRGGWRRNGSKTAAGWLARASRCPVGDARSQTRLARRWPYMALTSDALAGGLILAKHADVLAGLYASPRKPVAAAFAAAEDELVGYAKTLDFAHFMVAVRYWLSLVDQDGAEDKAQDNHDARRVHLSQTSTMTVTASAVAYGTPGVSHRAWTRRHHPVSDLVAITLGALALAVAVPADVVVLGVLLVGVTHVVLELRYVVGRHPDVVQGAGVAFLQAALAAVLLARLANTAGLTRGVELAAWASLLVVALARRFGNHPQILALGVALVGAATVLAAAAGTAWFLLLAHAHNLVPAVFVWQWSGRTLDRRARQAFRCLVVGWSAVVPVLLLGGAADAFAGSGSRLAERLFGIDAATATVAPSSWVGTTAGHRLLVAFAFAQLVHYALWIWFLPRHDPATTAAFATTRPGAALRGWRLPALAVAGTATVLGFAALDYRQGRTFYGALGGYHAYLEYPVLLGLLLDSLTRRRSLAAVAG